MDSADRPLPPEIWAATLGATLALIVAQRERVRGLEGYLRQHSSNSSRRTHHKYPPTAGRCPQDGNEAASALPILL